MAENDKLDRCDAEKREAKKRAREELVAWRAREIAWGATPLGRAFNAFKRALEDAVREDTKAEYVDESWSSSRLRKCEMLWARAREAESTLRGLMDATRGDSGC